VGKHHVILHGIELLYFTLITLSGCVLLYTV